MLFADAVEEFGHVVLFDRGSFLIGCPFGEFAQRAGDGGAVAECRAAQWLFAGGVGAFLGVEFECSAFLDSCEVGLHVDDAVLFIFRCGLQQGGCSGAVDAAFDVLGAAFTANDRVGEILFVSVDDPWLQSSSQCEFHQADGFFGHTDVGQALCQAESKFREALDASRLRVHAHHRVEHPRAYESRAAFAFLRTCRVFCARFQIKASFIIVLGLTEG